MSFRHSRQYGMAVRFGTGMARLIAQFAVLSLVIGVIVGCAQSGPAPAPPKQLSSEQGAQLNDAPNKSDGYAERGMPPRVPVSAHIAQSAIWAPDASYLLADICPRNFAPKDNCTLYRYRFSTQKWEGIPALASNDAAGYLYPAFSPDGKTIAATEAGYNCDEPGCPESRVGSRLVLLDLDGARLKYLSGNGLRLRPTFSKDGKRLLYWRGDVLKGTRALLGFWDVYEMDINSGSERQMSNFAASGIAAPPRYWPDGKRILLVAMDYYIKPNNDDYKHPTSPEMRTTYAGKHERNGSVVIEPGERRLWPYFKTEGPYVWLLVRDISPDGKWAIFDGRPGLIERPIGYPQGEARVLSRNVYHLRGATYSPDGKRLALIPEGGGYIEILDIASEDLKRITIDW